MDFDAFISTGWEDHADQAAAVADRLAALVPELDARQLEPWLRLWVHVLGEHLGEWERGIGGIESARGALSQTPGDDAASALAALDRGIATLRAARGDADACADLAPEDRAMALATAAAALAGRSEIARSLTLFDAALQAFDSSALPAPAVSRALAVAGNNLAQALEELPRRAAAETAGMLRAAEAALRHWSACGGWMETERACFRVACSALQAGANERAVAAGRECLAICEANGADAFERFFAQAMLARALFAAQAGGHATARDAAEACLAEVPEDERHWCETQRLALAALPR